jgi:hypothetical protein
MFHAEMFTSSIATGANTFSQINYLVGDTVLAPLNLGLQVSPTLPNLHSMAMIGVNAVHYRGQTASMLPFPYPTLDPPNRGGAAESPPRLADFSANPLPLRPTDEFDVFGTQNAAGAQVQYVLTQFSDGPPATIPVQILPPTLTSNPATPGRFTTAHWTASKTLIAGAWTAVTPIFDQVLPAGYYALIGARVFSASGLFFRMLPAMGPIWRPGGIAVQAYDQLDPLNQRYINWNPSQSKGWGVWLFFFQNVPPQIELFATAADTAEEGFFDIVYISNATTQPS